MIESLRTSAPSAPLQGAKAAPAPTRALVGPPSFTTVSVGTQIAAPDGKIAPGTTFYQGNWAISTSEVYVLILQTDGNLVLYQVIGAPPQANGTFTGYAMWWTGTTNPQDPGWTFAVQYDGNLVVYDENHNVLWSPNIFGYMPGALWVQNDGNLVMYNNVWISQWNSETNLNLAKLLTSVQQGDTGQFEAKTIAWHDLNNEGDNGATPTVTTLNETTLEINGGYSVDDFVIGKGTGTISLGVYLTGPATCVVTGTASGIWLNFQFSASGTWYAAGGDPDVQIDLDNGMSFQLTNDGDSLIFTDSETSQITCIEVESSTAGKRGAEVRS